MTRRIVLFATILLAITVPVPAATPAFWNDLSPDAQIVERVAGYLAPHRLDSTLSWVQVSYELDSAKDAVNRMAATMDRYASSSAPEEREAVERTLPLLKQVSMDTTMALESLDQLRPLPVNARLREALVKLDASAHQLARTVSDSNKLEKLRATAARLQGELSLRSLPR